MRQLSFLEICRKINSWDVTFLIEEIQFSGISNQRDPGRKDIVTVREGQEGQRNGHKKCSFLPSRYKSPAPHVLLRAILFNMASLERHQLRSQEYRVQISAPLVETVHFIALGLDFFICGMGIMSIMRITWANACKVPGTESSRPVCTGEIAAAGTQRGKQEKPLVPGRGSGMRQGL